jgi:RES domain-containing protein
VHVGQDEAPPDLNQIEIDVPDDVEIERIDAAALPPGWRRYPAPEKLQQVGNEWLEQQRTLVLQVPSAVIPKEHNYLLNPDHAEAHRLAVIDTQGFVYGSRRAPRSQ